MPDIHIRTFLRNLCSDSAEVVQKFEQKAKSNGGGNYYQASQLAITDITQKSAVYDQAVSRIMNIKKDGEREHNLHAFNTFHTWWLAHKGEASKAPHAHMFGPKGKLCVRLLPDLLIKHGAKREIVLIWNYGFAVPKRVAGLGVYAMKKHIGALGYDDCNFVVHDIFSGRRHCLGAIPEKAESILRIELTRQEEASIATAAPAKAAST